MNMNICKRILCLVFPAIILIMTACDQEPIFTEMSTNRLRIVIKGTLESENPQPWDSVFNPSVINSATSDYVDDSVDDNDIITDDVFPDIFMIDIAEIKLNGKAIGNYRQTFSIPLDDNQPFFNGEGITLVNDDPPDGNYDRVQLYIRKMIFDGANIYSQEGSGWSTPTLAEVIFREQTVEGFNFNNLQVNSYWDSLRTDSSSILRIFPLDVPIIGGMNYMRENGETVLEIRLVIKNFIKMYEYDYYDDGVYKVCHFWALSDWLRDVHDDEKDMGRNIHAVARAYVEGQTEVRTGSGTDGHYVILLPENDASDYRMPATTSGFRADYVPNYDLPLPPVYSGTHIESVLDYCCYYEAYKSDWNAIVTTYNSYDDYCTEWQAYEDAVKDFKIAPYVAIVSGGSYTFSNVAPGTYYMFTHSAPEDYGELFEGDWTSAGTVTVP